MTRVLLLVPALFGGCGLWIESTELPSTTLEVVDSGDSGQVDCPVLVASHPTGGMFWRGQLLHLAWDRPVLPADLSVVVTTNIGENTEVVSIVAAAGGTAHILGPQGRGWPTPVAENGWSEHVRAEVSWGCGSAVIEFDVSDDGDIAAEPVPANTVLEAELTEATFVGPIGTVFGQERFESRLLIHVEQGWQSNQALPDLTTTTRTPDELEACSPARYTAASSVFDDYAQLSFNTRRHLLYLDGHPVRVDAFQSELAMTFSGVHRVGRTVVSLPIADLAWEVPGAVNLLQVQEQLCATEWCAPCLEYSEACVRLVVEDVPLPTSLAEPFGPHDPCDASADPCDYCALGESE